MSEPRYYCRNCSQGVTAEDKVCPNCKASLEGNRNITLDLTASVDVVGTLDVLSPEEGATASSIYCWLKDNILAYKMTEVEVGFPSGIKVKFVKNRN